MLEDVVNKQVKQEELSCVLENGMALVFRKKSGKEEKGRKVASLAEFLFSERASLYMPVEAEEEQVKQVHKVYIESLVQMYEKLRKTMLKIQKYSRQHGKENAHFFSPPRLMLARENRHSLETELTNKPLLALSETQSTASSAIKVNSLGSLCTKGKLDFISRNQETMLQNAINTINLTKLTSHGARQPAIQ